MGMPILKGMKAMMVLTMDNASMSATATMMMNNAGKLATSAGKVAQAAPKVAMKATEKNALRNANVTGRMRAAGTMAAGTMAAGMMAAGTTATGMANGGEDY